jgi:saccharopine dehydrogenase (NAD+, L-lysine-forming)
MKYLVIGVGAIGTVIAKDLAQAKNTTEVGLADINLAFAQELADEIGGNTKAIHVDIYDEDILRRVIKDYDVVVNATGPFYKTVRYVVEACINEKVDYVDVADDSSAVEVLFEYDQRCKDAGITALICQGASPGTTNILALLGSMQLDKTNEIHTNWIVSMFSESNNIRNLGATYYHALEMSTGSNPQFLNGKMTRVPSATGTKLVQFIAPKEEYPVHYVGHGEPLTLSMHIPNVKTVTNRGNIWPAAMDVSNLKGFEAIGLADDTTLHVNGIDVNRRDIAFALMGEQFAVDPKDIKNVEKVEFQIHVEVNGEKEGKPVMFEYTCACEMNPATGLSASYGAQVVAHAEEKMTGIVAPEQYLKVKPYLQYLESKGFEFYVSITKDGKTSKPALLKTEEI